MEIDWKSVAREGNPLTEGDYFVTIITESGKYDTQIGTWQRGYWIFETSVVIAYTQNQSHTNASCLRQGRGLCFSRLFPAHCKDYNYIFQFGFLNSSSIRTVYPNRYSAFPTGFTILSASSMAAMVGFVWAFPFAFRRRSRPHGTTSKQKY